MEIQWIAQSQSAVTGLAWIDQDTVVATSRKGIVLLRNGKVEQYHDAVNFTMFGTAIAEIDGQHAVLCGSRGGLSWFGVETGKRLVNLREDAGNPTCISQARLCEVVAWTTDGGHWGVMLGEKRHTYQQPTTLGGPIAVSPDGGVIVAASYASIPWLHVVPSGRTTARLNVGREVSAIGWNETGYGLAVATAQGAVLWNPESWDIAIAKWKQKQVCNSRIWGVAYLTPIIWAGDDRGRLYEIDTEREEVRQLESPHKDMISQMAFSPDYDRLAIGSYDGSVSVWC